MKLEMYPGTFACEAGFAFDYPEDSNVNIFPSMQAIDSRVESHFGG